MIPFHNIMELQWTWAQFGHEKTHFVSGQLLNPQTVGMNIIVLTFDHFEIFFHFFPVEWNENMMQCPHYCSVAKGCSSIFSSYFLKMVVWHICLILMSSLILWEWKRYLTIFIFSEDGVACSQWGGFPPLSFCCSLSSNPGSLSRLDFPFLLMLIPMSCVSVHLYHPSFCPSHPAQARVIFSSPFPIDLFSHFLIHLLFAIAISRGNNPMPSFHFIFLYIPSFTLHFDFVSFTVATQMVVWLVSISSPHLSHLIPPPPHHNR